MKTHFVTPAILFFSLLFACFSPHAAGQSPASLTELKARLKTEMEKQHIAGMMLSIVTKDSVIFSGGLGYASISQKLPVSEHHLFRQASVTKLFLSLGILNLVHEKKLSLYSPLHEIAPEIPFKNKWENTTPVTIEQLLEHTTGFSDKSPFEEYNFTGEKITGLQALHKFKKFMNSRWKPGERHAYSNINYAVLGYIIEKISCRPLNEYLREKVFSPLQMPYANVDLTDDRSDRYSKGYVWKDRQFHLVPHQPSLSAGYASMNASAADFSMALQIFLRGWMTPGGQFLSPETLNDFENPHSYLSAKAGLKSTYAYGNESLGANGHIFRGHKGAIGGYLSNFTYNRKLGLGYAFSLNTHNEQFFHYTDRFIREFLLQKAAPVKEGAIFPINTKVVGPYLGYYRLSNPAQLYSGFFEGWMNTVHIGLSNNTLKAHVIGRGTMIWQATDKSGLFYKDKNALLPHIVLLKDSNNKLSIADGGLYFEKITQFEAFIPLIFFAFTILILTSSLFWAAMRVILLILKKNRTPHLLLQLSPVMATTGLLIIVWTIPQLLDSMREAKPMFKLEIWWFIGKYIFAIFTLASLSLLIVKWKKINSGLLKVYITSLSVALCFLLYTLIANSWYP